MVTRSAVVIGSGAGGLAAAAHLAKDGFDVLTLEQGEQLGGYIAPFSRSGFQFDPGIHYMGQCRRGQLVHTVLESLGVNAEGMFAELEPDGFDVYRFPDLEVRWCRGLDAYADRLSSIFPRERRGIARFFRAVRAYARAMESLSGSGWPSLGALAGLPRLLLWSRRTLADLLASSIADPRLRAVLAAPGGCYGLPPSRASALAGLGTIAHYADGAFFPRGGSAALRDALVRAGERHGARYRTHARAAKIIMHDGRAAGVELAGGERIEADFVVSDADPVVTFGQLLRSYDLPARLRRKVSRTEPSVASFGVYLGMRRDLRARGLGAFDVWDYPDWNIEASYAAVLAGELPREPMLFLSPASLKDDSGAMAPEGGSVLEILTFTPYALFERWRDRPPGARGEDYEAEKRRITDWMLEAVERRWPGLVGDVEVREASTPLTNESYTLAPRGGAYGPALTPEQSFLRRFGPSTPVRHLYLAGAGVFGDGVAACLASGRSAATLVARAAASEGKRSRARPRLREAHP